MNIIKDLRTLNALSKKYGFIVDKTYKYVLKENLSLIQSRELKKEGYTITYLSGCFYPFVTKEVK